MSPAAPGPAAGGPSAGGPSAGAPAYRHTQRGLVVAALVDGVGIHAGPRGWVYNVALGPAVRVVPRDGRAFLLGTDDPAGLVGALAPRQAS